MTAPLFCLRVYCVEQQVLNLAVCYLHHRRLQQAGFDERRDGWPAGIVVGASHQKQSGVD